MYVHIHLRNKDIFPNRDVIKYLFSTDSICIQEPCKAFRAVESNQYYIFFLLYEYANVVLKIDIPSYVSYVLQNIFSI